jgi:hypothetical protein
MRENWNALKDNAPMTDTYKITRHPTKPEALGCIDLCESEDDGGWYAHQYDFTRADNATRVSVKIYPTKIALIRALDAGKHPWGKWD